jgi:hypothetical protein
MNKVLISNNVPFHHDLIISVIEKYDFLLKIEKNYLDIIDVYLSDSNFDIKTKLNVYELASYIKKNYLNVNVIIGGALKDSDYSHKIYCSLAATEARDTDGDRDLKEIIENNSTAYIAHDVTDYFLKYKNIYFLSNFNRIDIPKENVFCVDRMPKVELALNKSIKSFVILGSFTRIKYDATRDFSILEKILSVEYQESFEINIVGSWHEEPFDIWNFLNKNVIHPSNFNKIKVHLNAGWNEFNKTIASADYIVPLLNKSKQPEYFMSKATSAIFYILGYNLNVFASNDFCETYSIDLNQSVVYNDSNITEKFREAIKNK